MPSIRKRRNKWQVQIRIKDAPALAKSFNLKQDAERWAREMEAQAQRGEVATNRKALVGITLGCLVKRYRQDVVPSKKSAKVERIILDAFLRHAICRKKLANITSADFAAYRDERLKKITAKSLKRQFSPIHNMFEVARDEWGLPIAENPLDKVKLKVVDNRRERRLKDGELERILEAAKTRRNPYIIPIILFALETAMRRGEILQLAWDDVDFKRSCVTIREAKNGYTRTVPLTPKALNILHNTLKCVSNGIRINKVDLISYLCTNLREIENILTKSNVVFDSISQTQVSESGKEFVTSDPNLSRSRESVPSDFRKTCVFPITANTFRLAWERSKRKAGIQDLHFHDLRHEAISRFFELGLTVPEVASISGHRDARMLLRYAHAQTKVVQEKLRLL